MMASCTSTIYALVLLLSTSVTDTAVLLESKSQLRSNTKVNVVHNVGRLVHTGDLHHIPKRDHSCSINADCGWHAKCDSELGECATKRIGEDLRADVLMGVCGFLVAAISLAAGVGGGGLNVPLLMMVLSFDAHVATAMSQAMLTGGALAAFIYNFSQSHPLRPKRSLINFELASLIGAAVVTGAQVGSVIHAMAPPALILLLLCLVLIQAAKKGVANAQKISKREAEAKLTASPSPDDAAGDALAEADDPHAAMVSERSYTAQKFLIGFFVLVVALIVSKNLFFRICSPMWWTMTAAALFILAGFTYKMAKDLSEQEPVDEEDLNFADMAFPLAKYCVISGLLAALCGIGGGMVIGPLLTTPVSPDSDRPFVSPPVAAATTATTLLVLASSTCLMYVVRGTLPGSYAMTLMCCTFLGAGAGKVLIGRWIKKTGKQSVIVWILAGITILSVFLMASQGARTVMHDGWRSFNFRNFCRGVRSDMSPQEQISSDMSIPHDEALSHFFF